MGRGAPKMVDMGKVEGRKDSVFGDSYTVESDFIVSGIG